MIKRSVWPDRYQPIEEFSVNKTSKIAFAAALLCCIGPALAQSIHPSWYIQPGISAIQP